jgi:hypothetical protein
VLVVPLGAEETRALLAEGYVLWPGLVARDRVDAALGAINASLGQEGIARDALDTMRAQTFCPELANAPPILDLYRGTQLAALARAAVGPERVRDPGVGQIALRFPSPRASRVEPRPHIDGMPQPLNGVAPGTIYHFTALAAVFLSDTDGPFQGNFTVWPGTHRELASHFGAHGTDVLLQRFPPIALPAPRQLVVRAGDALLAHYLLAHSAAPNLGPHVRYAVFFRLFHDAHDPASTATLVDLWREWDGVG